MEQHLFLSLSHALKVMCRDILPIEICFSCYMCVTNLDEVFLWCAVCNRYQGRVG